VIVLDTSALLALLDRDDPDHDACTAALKRERPPFLVPAGILSEVGYLVPLKVGLPVLCTFLEDLTTQAYLLDCGENDFPRIAALMTRYANLPLGFADSCVIACAERSGRRVLTLDRRDFSVVAGEGTIELALDSPE
jgi:predicted nucleic acid-binding protein